MSTVRSNNKAAHLALTAVALGALAFASGACERDQRAYGVDRDRGKEPTTTPVMPGERDKPLPAEQHPQVTGIYAAAVDSIAMARCEREAKCNNIGADKKFTTKEACLAEIRRDQIDGLNAADCPGGVDQKELSECLQEIRNEDCNNPLDSLGRLAACRTSDMCKATGAPNE